MRTAAILIVFSFASLARADVLVAGNPPLTDEVVDHTCDFLEWAIDTPFTLAQRDAAKTLLIEFWRKQDHGAIDTVQKLLAARDQLAKQTPAARQEAQQKAGTQIVDSLRKDAKDPASRWLLSIYSAGHTSLAAGDPPLTRQAIDAYAELLGFVLGEARQGKPVQPDRAYEDTLAKSIVAGWKKLEPAQRQQIAQLPIVWAAVRAQWAGLGEPERAKYREQWGKALAPPKQQKTIAETMVQYQQLSAILKMQRDMSTIITCNMSTSCSYQWRW